MHSDTLKIFKVIYNLTKHKTHKAYIIHITVELFPHFKKKEEKIANRCLKDAHLKNIRYRCNINRCHTFSKSNPKWTIGSFCMYNPKKFYTIFHTLQNFRDRHVKRKFGVIREQRETTKLHRCLIFTPRPFSLFVLPPYGVMT